MNQNPLERLHQLAGEMESKLEKVANRLSLLSKTPQAGDIFLFDNPETIGLQWVLLFSHPEDKQLWLAVPADDNPMGGPTDIAISEKALCGPLTLRCGQSVWKRETDFDMTLRVGILENWHRYRATDKLKQIFEGKIQSTAWQRETEADPDYEEWMGQVSYEREALMKQQDLSALLLFKKTLVNLSQWLKDDFVGAIKAGWLELDMFPINVAFPAVRAKAVKRSKQINLGRNYTVALVFDLAQVENQDIEILFWVCAAGEQTTLPKNLKFAVFDKSSGIEREKTANGKEKYIPIKWSFSVGEQFCVGIQLDDVNVTESFMF